jgi:hypothetical protein
MRYKIDSNTPIPAPRHYSCRKKTISIAETIQSMYPDKNRSFLIPLKGRKVTSIRSAVTSAANHLRIKKNMPNLKVTTRYIPEQKGIRVWRIA